MLAGFHVSIAGGMTLSVGRAKDLGCTTMQIFSHSPRAWKLTDIPGAEAASFRDARTSSGISPVFVHTSYLINLASDRPELYTKSIDALRMEMLRADALGAEYVVTHLGSASGSTQEDAKARVSEALIRALDGLRVDTRLLLENTAGERGDVGYQLEDIASIISTSGVDGVGVTLDTCHSFGAGYDIKSAKGLEGFVKLVDSTFGLERLKLIHLNDSKHPLGSRRDRHEDIGKGEIGRTAFRRLINHPKLRDIPFIMETPKSSPEDDIRNMATLISLRA